MTHLLIEPGQAEREGRDQYRARGGYRGLARTLERGGAWAMAELESAGLRGRGASGKGMPTAVKWRQVASAFNPTHYVVANGAETSPVSRKDRYLLAQHPPRDVRPRPVHLVAKGGPLPPPRHRYGSDGDEMTAVHDAVVPPSAAGGGESRRATVRRPGARASAPGSRTRPAARIFRWT